MSEPSRHPVTWVLGGLAAPVRSSDLLTDDHPYRPSPPVHRWRRNAGLRALAFGAGALVTTFVVGAVTGALHFAVTGRMMDVASRGGAMALTGMTILVFVAAYLLLATLMEGRRLPTELAPSRAAGVLRGLLLGTVLQLVCVGALWVAGAYRVQGFDWSYDPLPMLVAAGFGAGIIEEILFRGVVFRLLEETVGTWLSTAVSGLVFGLVHLGNPEASLQGALAIALEAGVLFAVVYALTRSLWLVMGLHLAWNMVQGPVLGIVVSGSAAQGSGYVRSTLEGPTWLAGGAFGMEASLVTVAILTGFTTWLVLVLRRSGHVVQPFWVRRRLLAGAGAAAPEAATAVTLPEAAAAPDVAATSGTVPQPATGDTPQA